MHSCKYFAAKELSAQLIPTYSPAFFPSLYLYIRYDEIFGAAKPLKSEARPPNFFSSFQPRQIPRNAPATRGSILSDLTSYASFSRRYRSINTFFFSSQRNVNHVTDKCMHIQMTAWKFFQWQANVSSPPGTAPILSVIRVCFFSCPIRSH